jgi:hypothetical protein
LVAVHHGAGDRQMLSVSRRAHPFFWLMSSATSVRVQLELIQMRRVPNATADFVLGRRRNRSAIRLSFRLMATSMALNGRIFEGVAIRRAA